MDKKITRRVVLGTTIAALAAGPFVMRAWRKNHAVDIEVTPLFTQEDLPSPPPSPSVKGRFFQDWNLYRDHFLWPTSSGENLKTVQITPKLSVQKKWKFRKLNTHIQGVHSSLDTFRPDSDKAMYYEIIEGDITTGSDKLVATVTKNESRIVMAKTNRKSQTVVTTKGNNIESVIYDQSPIDEIKVNCRATGVFDFVFRDDIFGATTPLLHNASQLNSAKPEIVVLNNDIFSSLRFVFSEIYELGQDIIVPASTILMCGWDIPRIQSVNSIESLANQTNLTISGRQAFTGQQLRSYYNDLKHEYLKQTEPKIVPGTDESTKKQIAELRAQFVDSLEKRIEQSLGQEKCRFENRRWQIETASGIVLRYEKTRQAQDEINGFSMFEQFQMDEA